MINLREECKGYYKIEAVKADGTRRVLADWFPNLILDAGLNRMGDNGDYLNFCQAGSGSTAPAPTQTSLVSRVAGTDSVQSDTFANSGASPYFARRTIVFRFAQGVATGVLAEVGVGWASTGSLYSRALILDALGNPTTITVLADESLDVTYELRIYAWVNETVGAVTLKGIDHSVTQKTALAAQWAIPSSTQLNAGNLLSANPFTAYTGPVSSGIEGQPTGTSLGAVAAVAAAYAADSLSRTVNITAGLGQANNASGIGSLLLPIGWGFWQIGFTPNVMKTSSDILTLQVRHSWGRKA